jgi:hypothetical protein
MARSVYPQGFEARVRDLSSAGWAFASASWPASAGLRLTGSSSAGDGRRPALSARLNVHATVQSQLIYCGLVMLLEAAGDQRYP